MKKSQVMALKLGRDESEVVVFPGDVRVTQVFSAPSDSERVPFTLLERATRADERKRRRQIIDAELEAEATL